MLEKDGESKRPAQNTTRRFIAVIVVLSFMLGSTPNASWVQAPSLVEGNTVFALELYGQLKTNPGNIFFSPYSIFAALAMTYAGATVGRCRITTTRNAATAAGLDTLA